MARQLNEDRLGDDLTDMPVTDGENPNMETVTNEIVVIEISDPLQVVFSQLMSQFQEMQSNLESKLESKKVKVSPLQVMKAHGGCGCKGPHIHSHGTRKR